MARKHLSKSNWAMNIIFCVMFSLFAVIQLNDPDPVLWFSIYMSVAVVSILANYINVPRFIIGLMAMVLLVFALMHFSFVVDWLGTEDKSEIFGEMVYDKPYLEGAREFIGLFMAFSVLVFQLKK